ncbi:MAG: leucine--tRNA ligase [Bacteroidetes bacterium]|nr:leucine--tRNA ligase [Bacteroidota bacterium]MBS1930972.1 leucine--tRNA ligase [Bacteroidota bacterium]
MEYNFNKIERYWQDQWSKDGVYHVENNSVKPKCYVLDMFPYPSGAGLHVGHPLGYIASDIYARYKRLKGFNVLHPMGYDAFGLPAEQYAIEHGIHPAVSTENNIKNFRSQLDKIGFCFDWSREVNTSKPGFYKWTQWIFLQLFDCWYNRKTQKAERIDALIAIFEKGGNQNHPVPDAKFEIRNPDFEILKGHFNAAQWKSFDEKTKHDILMEYRLAYCGYGEVNWCEALGTVLANDEVINGVSERGGHPVVKKTLRQWYLRITEYADRLLEGLNHVDFSDAMKEMQTNWIGKSFGANIQFSILHAQRTLEVFTTRPDTIYGVDFMVIAPEHDLVNEITTGEHRAEVDKYIEYVQSRSERERMSDKKITGVFSGAYCIHPFTKKQIPVWISEYVLIGYGTGAIMAVPCGDERDHKFAKHFNIPITNIIGSYYNGEEANPTKDALLENSGFLDGMLMKDAIETAIKKIEEIGIGKQRVNFKMRDAAFSRQRYWGEPFPIIWKNGIAYPLEEQELPLQLPHVDSYKPGPEGEGPLANIPEWTARHLETNTMPGYAGSSWYFLRYMDPHNEKEFCDRKASDYWNQVDLYIGGTEHAVGHLLYSRMWTKFLFDLGLIGFDEPYKKLVNQGMIQGSSRFVYRVNYIVNEPFSKTEALPFILVSYGLVKKIEENNETGRTQVNKAVLDILDAIHQDLSFLNVTEFPITKHRVPVNIVDGIELDINSFRILNSNYANAEFILEDGTVYSKNPNGKYICGTEVEKMSKSKFNTVSPYNPPEFDKNGNKTKDESGLVIQYGADTFRMYEMFLGPVEMSKPWDTKGIEGVHRFLKKFWRLFYDEIKGRIWDNEKPVDAELKVLHKTIKKVEEDTERFSFNTAVSAFMIATNELTDLKCHKKEVLEPLLILLAPYAPHICEELWHLLGHTDTILVQSFPRFEEKYLAESSKDYPISVNGKHRTTINISLDITQAEVEKIVLANSVVQKWLDGKPHKKIIFVKGKMVNIVI